MLQGIEETDLAAIGKIKRIRELLDAIVSLVKDRIAKIYSKKLVELLFVHPYCKIEFLSDRLKVERKAASRNLYQLEERPSPHVVRFDTYCSCGYYCLQYEA
jgi:hypothetical protein